MRALSILYVDDDPDIRTIVSLALSLDPAITTRVARSGTEALALIAQGFVPDVAVLDVMMPDMDGTTLLEHLRDDAATVYTPVIFMTAKGRRADVAGYRAHGVIGVILKPFDPVHLAREIRALLEAYEERGKNPNR